MYFDLTDKELRRPKQAPLKICDVTANGAGILGWRCHLYFLFARFLAYYASSRSQHGVFGIVKDCFTNARIIVLLFSVPLTVKLSLCYAETAIEV